MPLGGKKDTCLTICGILPSPPRTGTPRLRHTVTTKEFYGYKVVAAASGFTDALVLTIEFAR